MIQQLLGIDIGGTKCAVIFGLDTDGDISIADKVRFDTTGVQGTIDRIISELKGMCARHGLDASNTRGIGISCGGPLDSRKGIVMSPPNLPGWDNIPIVNMVREATGIPAVLQNDANACALAEWKYGAGRGTRNMVFLTFGTGLGAGLVLDGRLYSGTNDNAARDVVDAAMRIPRHIPKELVVGCGQTLSPAQGEDCGCLTILLSDSFGFRGRLPCMG